MTSLAKKLTIKKKVWKQVARQSVVSLLSVLMTFGQSGLLVLTALTPTAVTADTGPKIVINEWLIDPLPEADPDDELEFVELYNAGTTTVNLNGWALRGFGFISGLSGDIAPGERKMIYDGNLYLDNGQDLKILDDNGEVIDEVDADATGRVGWTYGRKTDGGSEFAWFSPAAVTENAPNVCEVDNGDTCTLAPPKVVINEFIADPSSGGGEFVELYNYGETPVELEGWVIKDELDQEFARLTGLGALSTLNPKDHFMIARGGSVLNNDGDTVKVYDNEGTLVDSITYGDDGEKGWSYGRKQDGGTEITRFLPSAVTGNESNRCEVTNGEWCASDLVEALNEAQSGDTVELLTNISIDEQANLGSGVTLQGNGYTLSASFPKTSNSNNAALGIIGESRVTINNLSVDGTGTLPWPDHLHGINIYESTNVELNDVTAQNFSASGVVVNGSEVTVNDITTAGNGWHGINVDQGSGVTAPAILTVNGVSNQTDNAHIYLDKFATADVTVNDTNGQYESSDNVLKTGDRLYQLKTEPQTVEVSDLVVTHDDAAQNIYVEFDINNELELTLPTVDQLQIIALYTNLDLALESGNSSQIEAAVNALGDDIITEYYYLNDDGDKVYLSTIGANPLVKNKYWTRYLVNSDDSQRYPDHGAGVTTIPAGTYRTNTNPLTGSVADGWLEEAAGKDVFVKVTVLSNGEVRTQTESVTLPEPPDSIRPVVTVTSNVKEYNNQDFSIDVEATDAESGLKKVVINLYDQNGFLAPCVNAAGEGAATKSVSCDIDVDELGDGEFYIKTNARDEADNMSRTVTQEFKIDISDPTVDIDNPENGMILPGNFDISGTWEDAFSGIDFIRVWINRKIDGSFAGRVVNDKRAQVNGDGTFLYEAKNIPSGNYDLKINGVDKAGNDDFASNVNVTVDADSPEASSVVVNGMNVEDADLRGANCQDIANTYKVNGDLNFSATLNDELSGVANARYRIRKLNSNGCTMSSVYSSGQMNLEYDDETDKWSNTTGFDTTALEDGVYTIMMTIQDNVGNQSVRYADIEVNNTHPTITDVTYLRNGVEASVFAPGDQMTIRVTTEDLNDVTRVQYWARKFPWDGSSQLSAGELIEVSENLWEKTITVPSEYTNGDEVNEELLGNYVNFRPFDEVGNSHIGWRENFTIDAYWARDHNHWARGWIQHQSASNYHRSYH